MDSPDAILPIFSNMELAARWN